MISEHLKFSLKILGVVSTFFYANTSAAYTCSTKVKSTTITSPTITVQRDLPVGSPIGSVISTGNINAFECQNTPAPDVTYTQYGIKGYTNYVTTINNRRVYSTSIPGIGYAVNGGFCSFNAWVDGQATGDGNADNRLICDRSGVSNDTYGALSIQLYKTAQTTGSGTSTRQKVGSIVMRLDKSSWWLDESEVFLASFRVNTLACTLNTSTLNIAMGKIDKNMFTGIGTYPGDANTKNVDIVLNCNAGTNVNLLVQGTTVNASNGVLKLASATGAATGVGIQILNGSAPLALNQTVAIKSNASSGSYTIPLKARYYQTETKITSGTANATSTFTLTYR